jgi:hypothetical protein
MCGRNKCTTFSKVLVNTGKHSCIWNKATRKLLLVQTVCLHMHCHVHGHSKDTWLPFLWMCTSLPCSHMKTTFQFNTNETAQKMTIFHRLYQPVFWDLSRYCLLSTAVSITLFTLNSLHPYMWQASDLASQPSYTNGKVVQLDDDCDEHHLLQF